ncbi:MAG: hypothetical protein R6U96_19245 [Promethearchaeia archaeon]
MGLFSRDKEKKEKQMGFDESEAEEAEKAEEVLGTEMEEEEVSIQDPDLSTTEIETVDADTGKVEGEIVLKDGESTGERILVNFIEDVNVKQDHALEDVAVSFDGELEVKNPSKVSRVWDIDLTLENTDKTDIGEEEIDIRELGTSEDDNSWSKQFKLSGEAKNLLLVKEYISTLPREEADNVLNPTDIDNDLDKFQEKEVEQVEGDFEEEEIEEEDRELEKEKEDLENGAEDTGDEEELPDGGAEVAEYSLESFAVPKDAEKTITFVIAMKNLFDTPLQNIEVTKQITDQFQNISILDVPVGMADENGELITWSIEELEPDKTVMLKFTADILTSYIDSINTGKIEVTYEGISSFAEGLKVDKFDAYTRNKFYVETLERDEEPGVWDCQLTFENTSDFIVQLLNADVYDPENMSEKLVDIDPHDVQPLPRGAHWTSKGWTYESQKYPSFKRILEFRVMPDFETFVNGALSIDDTKLEIASIKGRVLYSLDELADATEEEEAEYLLSVPTFEEKDIYASLKIINDGSAPLNEIKVTQNNFSEVFKAPDPSKDEIRLFWDGDEIQVEEDAIAIEGNTLQFTLEDLKDSDMGMFESDSELELQYPIHCSKPKRDDRFASDIMFTGNTYPVSETLEYIPDVPEVEAVHLRRKFRIGKEVIPVGKLGKYRIELTAENRGNMALSGLVLMDKVPDSFEYTNESEEPEIVDEVEGDILKWPLDSLEEGETVRITYEIIGSKDYHPSDAQIGL